MEPERQRAAPHPTAAQTGCLQRGTCHHRGPGPAPTSQVQGPRPHQERLTSSSWPELTQQEPPKDFRVPGSKGAGPPPLTCPPPAPSKGPCRPTVSCTLPWSVLNPQGLLKHPATPVEAPRLPPSPCPEVLPLRPGSPEEQVGKLSAKRQRASTCASAGLTSVMAAAAQGESKRKRVGVTETNKTIYKSERWAMGSSADPALHVHCSSPLIAHLPPRDCGERLLGPPLLPPLQVTSQLRQGRPGQARVTCFPRGQPQAREGRSGCQRGRASGGGGRPSPL